MKLVMDAVSFVHAMFTLVFKFVWIINAKMCDEWATLWSFRIFADIYLYNYQRCRIGRDFFSTCAGLLLIFQPHAIPKTIVWLRRKNVCRSTLLYFRWIPSLNRLSRLIRNWYQFFLLCLVLWCWMWFRFK